MQRPDRVTVPTCIGCGAMRPVGDLRLRAAPRRSSNSFVRSTSKALTELASGAHVRAEACRAVARELASDRPGPDDWEATTPRCKALHAPPCITIQRFDGRSAAWDEPAEGATTWWCAGCGGIDAPQPCLGICIWRPIDWVNANLYGAGAHTRACRARRGNASAPAAAPRRVHHTREGHWELGCRVLQAEARETLDVCTR